MSKYLKSFTVTVYCYVRPMTTDSWCGTLVLVEIRWIRSCKRRTVHYKYVLGYEKNNISCHSYNPKQC